MGIFFGKYLSATLMAWLFGAGVVTAYVSDRAEFSGYAWMAWPFLVLMMGIPAGMIGFIVALMRSVDFEVNASHTNVVGEGSVPDKFKIKQ
ncbi:protein of unknown function [Burkholderia multivorans]